MHKIIYAVGFIMVGLGFACWFLADIDKYPRLDRYHLPLLKYGTMVIGVAIVLNIIFTLQDTWWKLSSRTCKRCGAPAKKGFRYCEACLMYLEKLGTMKKLREEEKEWKQRNVRRRRS